MPSDGFLFDLVENGEKGKKIVDKTLQNEQDKSN
jgi:hypothetical protein